MENNRNNKLFKIIAIEPLKGCESYILKNLKIDKKYYFYQGYNINNDSYTIDEEEIISDTFFCKNGLSISIHAIVGQNGSGKSALVELFMRVINNLSFIYWSEEKNCFPIKGLDVNIYYLLENEIHKIHLPAIDKNGTINATHKLLNKINSSEKFVEETLKQSDKTFLKKFFYSIIINYSMYAYNKNDFIKEWISLDGLKESQDIVPEPDKCWIDGVCHKNDGYAMPLVINPMRIAGNVDVNNEKHLTISRLLTLLIKFGNSDNGLNILNGKKKIKSLKFSIRSESGVRVNFNPIPNWAKSIEYKLRRFFEKERLFNLWNQEINEIIFKETCCEILKTWNERTELGIKKDINFDLINTTTEYNYLVSKTMSVINTYYGIICPNTTMIYDNFIKPINYKDSDDEKDKKKRGNIIKEHIEAILSDKSHITVKIRQTLNYIKHTKGTYDYKNNYLVAEFSETLYKMREFWEKDSANLMYFMPPPFFKVTIMYANINSSEEYDFDSLSSGEKQYVFSTSTILYHIRNIESAYNSANEDRTKYEYINLILEEIELYYHPEMQRCMVQDLVNSIHDMNFTHIKAVNICMVTHSPIILSDIPKQNILFLEGGSPKPRMQDNTFAANIHSLYKNNFFMDLPMGNFAIKKVQTLFERLREKDLPNEELAGIKQQINLIGEPILRDQLMSLYYKKCNIEERIAYLERELESLKEGKDNDKN